MIDKGILQIFAEGIRQMLVVVYDNGQRMNANGEAFPAGFASAIEEISIRLIGEDFDTYEERVRKSLQDQARDQLAAEFEDVMQAAVIEGKCDLIVGPDGEKRYSPHDNF